MTLAIWLLCGGIYHSGAAEQRALAEYCPPGRQFLSTNDGNKCCQPVSGDAQQDRPAGNAAGGDNARQGKPLFEDQYGDNCAEQNRCFP